MAELVVLRYPCVTFRQYVFVRSLQKLGVVLDFITSIDGTCDSYQISVIDNYCCNSCSTVARQRSMQFCQGFARLGRRFEKKNQSRC
jgi:hypothetical protein